MPRHFRHSVQDQFVLDPFGLDCANQLISQAFVPIRIVYYHKVKIAKYLSCKTGAQQFLSYSNLTKADCFYRLLISHL